MSKKIKIILALAVVVFAAVGGVFYIVSSKIDPEMIKASAVEAIESNLKGVKAEIGEVSYNLGFTVRLNVNGLKIQEKQGKGELFSVEKTQIEIPVFSILTNGGTIDIKVLAPKIVYKDLAQGGSNWLKALPEGEKKESKNGNKIEEKEKSAKASLPAFVENSRIDLKVANLSVLYQPLNAKPSSVVLNKILFKNLNLKKTTAFEVVSSVDYGLDSEKSIKADFQLVGEIALNKFFENGAVDTNMVLNVERIALSWLDLNLPPLKNVIRFNRKADGAIETNLRTTAGNLASLETDAKIDGEFTQVALTNFLLKSNLGSLPSVLGPTFQQVFAQADMNQSVFSLEGSALVHLAKKAFKPQLNFSLSSPITLNFGGTSLAVSAQGRFIGENFSLKLKNELLSGVATVDASTRLDPLNIPSDLAKMSPINASLLITNLKLEKPFIQKLLYKKESADKEQTAEASTENESGEKSEEPFSLPPFKVALEGKHIFIDKREMNFSGELKGGGNRASLPALNIVYGAGRAKLEASSVLKNSQDISTKFSIELGEMEMAGLNAFLPPLISGIEGRYEGNVSGTAKTAVGLSYDVSANIKAVNGELKNLNLSSFLLPLIEKISLLKGKVKEDQLKISDKFETLDLKARATEKFVNLGQFQFVGNNRSLVLTAKGKVSMAETGDSSVKGDLVVAEIASEVKKITGTNEIPLLFQGKGFGLMPQVKYTTDRLTERAAKMELGKQKNKIEKKIKKEKKKLENDLKNKAKDLLKGFKL